MGHPIKILVLDNHLINPPESGGPLRIVNLFGNLGDNFEVTYLGVTGWQYIPANKREIKNNFYEQVVPLSKLFIIMNNFFHNVLKSIPSFDISCAYLMFLTPRYIKILKKEIKNSDILITSHPWFINYIKNEKKKVIIYDSHNCEYLLYKEFFKKNLFNKLFLNFIKKIEKDACLKSDAILACSMEDKEKFMNLYKIKESKIQLVPNPIDLSGHIIASKENKKLLRKKYDLTNAKTALFIGTNFLPNIEAFRFIVDSLSPRLKDVTFLIIGEVCRAYEIDYNKIKMIALPEKSSSLGTGWFDVERWGKEGFEVRWTKKEFNFFINEESVSEIEIEYRSLKKIIGSIFINDAYHSKISFHTGIEFKKIKIPLLMKGLAKIGISLNRLNKSLFFDTRDVGIAIKNISYVQSDRKKHIDLNSTILHYILPKNVRLFGKVSNDELSEILNISDLALNPVKHGSGLNIKMLDYMAYNIPIVSTKVGLRGINIAPDESLISCELYEFEKSIKRLLVSKQGSESRTFIANNYDVNTISGKLKPILEKSVYNKNSSQ